MSREDRHTPSERTPQELAALLSDLAADTEEPAPRTVQSGWRRATEDPPKLWKQTPDSSDVDLTALVETPPVNPSPSPVDPPPPPANRTPPPAPQTADTGVDPVPPPASRRADPAIDPPIPHTLTGADSDELGAPTAPPAAAPESTPSAWSTREPKPGIKPSRAWPTPRQADPPADAPARPGAIPGPQTPGSRMIAGVTLHGAPAMFDPEQRTVDPSAPTRPLRSSRQPVKRGRFGLGSKRARADRTSTPHTAAAAVPSSPPRAPTANMTLSGYSGSGGGRVSPRAKLLFSVAGVLLVLLIVLILAGGSAKTAGRPAAHHTPAQVPTETASSTSTVATTSSAVPPPAPVAKQEPGSKTRTAKPHPTTAQKRAAASKTAERRAAAAKTARKRAAARKAALKRATAKKAAQKRAAARKAAAKRAASRKAAARRTAAKQQ